MLEKFLVPAAAQRLRSGVFGVCVDKYCAQLVGRGYRGRTIRGKLWVVGQLARWLLKKRLTVGDLDEQRIGSFLDQRRRCGRRWRDHGTAVFLLLRQLHSDGVVPKPPKQKESSASALLARYADYLRRERGLTEGTIALYQPFVRAFAIERLSGGAARPERIRPKDIHDFLLKRNRQMATRQGQSMAGALRSFLRFLFLRGETEANLSLYVPTVRRYRLASVPRHLPAREVERLLRSCNRSSATGRRDHAVLLLLARLGLRASEVSSLELDDLRWREGEIVVHGKGLTQDRLPLPADVGQALALYLQMDRPKGVCRRVFICRQAPHRGFGHPSTVSTIVSRALARAGLTPVTRGAHLLRHSLAVAMLRRGASLSEIGEVLRHRAPGTTEIYAKVDFGALRDVALPWPLRRGVR